MDVKHVVWSLTAAMLLTPASIGVVSTQSAEHARHDDFRHDDGTLPAAVREATERFLDINAALAAGYVQNGGCVSGQDEGAMGVHFANFALFDDRLEVDRPEVLVYEPRQGRLHLVAAEYATPAAAWYKSHQPGDQPHLSGHFFHFAGPNNRYGPDAFFELHVWAWKKNARGTFADWNPNVSCDSWIPD